eukprot:m.92479 g.92479  ORF g.92479 m.92479 type:complete len:1086 (-) comp14669_c0_seq2:328-3585(-)
MNEVLWQAVQAGDLSGVQAAVSSGADVNFRGPHEDRCNAPLHLASGNGYSDIAQLLIELGADVNVNNYDNNTPLHFVNVHLDIALLLIKHGADINAKNNWGDTALHWVSDNGVTGTASLLIEHGADINAKNNDEETSLHLATHKGHTDVVSLLIDRGADVNAKKKDDITALHIAAENGHFDIARLLIEHGGDLHAARAWTGWTPLHCASTRGHADICRLLIEHGADGNCNDANGRTPLDYAETVGVREVFRTTKRLYQDVTTLIPLKHELALLKKAKLQADAQVLNLQQENSKLQMAITTLTTEKVTLQAGRQALTNAKMSLETECKVFKAQATEWKTKFELLSRTHQQILSAKQVLEQQVKALQEDLKRQEALMQQRGDQLQQQVQQVQKALNDERAQKVAANKHFAAVTQDGAQFNLSDLHIDQQFRAIESLLNLDIDISRLEDRRPAVDSKNKIILGTSGQLYRAKYGGHMVALKQLAVAVKPCLADLLAITNSTEDNTEASRASLESGVDVDDEHKLRLHREIRILLSLRHPNIVTFMGMCYNPADHNVCLMTSWTENSSLHEYLHVANQTLSVCDSLRVLAEIAGAMEFLHANNVVHRDLKSANILLDGALSSKLCDFGLSALRGSQSKVTFVQGTEIWASPEQLLGDVAADKLRADTDVFSFGCVMWEVLFVCVPWHHLAFPTARARVKAIERCYEKQEYLPIDREINHRRLTQEQQELLKGCFQTSGQRLDFSQLHAALAEQATAAKRQAAVSADQQTLMLHGPDDAVWKYPKAVLHRLSTQFIPLTTRASVQVAPLDLTNADNARLVEQLQNEACAATACQNVVAPFVRPLVAAAIAICPVKNVAFHGCMQRNITRYRGKDSSPWHPFKPKYDLCDAEQKAVLDWVTHHSGPLGSPYRMLDENLVAQDPPIRIQRVFHGVKSYAAVIGILGGDFAQLQSTDAGWYGAGFYFTPDLDYALAYAYQDPADPAEPIPSELEGLNLVYGRKYRLVLVCDVQYGNPYPVLQRMPGTSGDGAPLKGGHDAHVAVVNFTSGHINDALPFDSCKEWRQATNKPVAEIVVNDPSCVLLRGVLVFEV